MAVVFGVHSHHQPGYRIKAGNDRGQELLAGLIPRLSERQDYPPCN